MTNRADERPGKLVGGSKERPVEVTSTVVVRSSRQTAVAQVISQSTRFLTSIVLARLLTPDDFGVVAVALIIMTVLDRFRDMGTGAAIIQRREVDDGLLNAVFLLNVVMGLAMSGLIFGFAAPLASAMGNPDAAAVIRVFAGIAIITALGQIHQSLLRRRMQFRRIAVITAVAAVVTAAVSVVAALFGLTYWALVLGTGVGTAVSTVMLWVYDPWRPTRHVSWRGLKSIAWYSWHIFLSDLLFLVWNQLDKVIVGRFVGTTGLGLYTMGQRVVTTPLTALSSVIDEVTFPAFSRRQDDDAALRSGFTRTACVVALVIFPLMAGIAVVAEPFVSVVLGDQWAALVPIIWVLAPAGAIQAVTFNSGQLLLAKGRSDWTYRWGILYVAVLGTLELAMSRWGATGVALGYAVGTALLTPFSLMLAFRLVHMRLRTYVVALLPFATMSAAMAGTVAVVSWLTSQLSAPDLLRLFLAVLVGVAVYALQLIVWRPPALKDALAAVRGRVS
jgi:PST family polysaccharide transporter